MSSVLGAWPEWSLPGLAWTHHPAGLTIGCVLIAVSSGCASPPSAGPFRTTDSTRPPIESPSPTTAPPPPAPTTTTTTRWTHDELRVELLEMMRQDQLERTGEGLPAGTPLPPIQDHARAARLTEMVDEFGWPTFDMVGEDGATAAWLVAQHADHDVELQASWLVLMGAAAGAGQADPTEVAYLMDRVAVNQREPQRYGTQIRCQGGVPTPATPIEDAPNVDERRRSMGLESLTAYYDELSMMCAHEDAEGQGPAD